MKACSKCKEEKELDCFYTQYKKSNRKHSQCKDCMRASMKLYREKNDKLVKERKKIYRDNNKDKISQHDKEYQAKNKDKIAKKSKEYRDTHKDKLKARSQSYYQRNREQILSKVKAYTEQNREKILKYKSEWQKNNYTPYRRVVKSLRRRILGVLNGTNKSASTLELLGCSFDEFIKYIENQFTDGMTWDNYGKYGWHLDHIKECYTFDLTKPEEQQKCFHYTNLRPLWAKDNLSRPRDYSKRSK
jgi:hypothetical protein